MDHTAVKEVLDACVLTGGLGIRATSPTPPHHLSASPPHHLATPNPNPNGVQEAAQLRVPLFVKVQQGPSWGELREIEG